MIDDRRLPAFRWVNQPSVFPNEWTIGFVWGPLHNAKPWEVCWRHEFLIRLVWRWELKCRVKVDRR